MPGGFLAWLAEGRAFYVLHDPLTIMSRYKRGRGREIVAETVAKTLASARRSSGFSVTILGLEKTRPSAR